MKKVVLVIVILGIAISAATYSTAEELFDLPDNFSILDGAIDKLNYFDLKEYSVTYRNIQEYYEPEDFSACAVLSAEEYPSDYNRMENYISYVFTNGCRLIMPNAVTLIYGDADREKYEQLIYYFENTNYPNEKKDLSFQKLDDAIAFCIERLNRLGITNLSVDKAVTLSSEVINKQTISMLSFYGSDTVQYFHNTDEDNEAYYISFRYYFDGVEMIGEPQAEFVITSDGISSLKLYHIFENIYDDGQIGSYYPVEKVLSHFAEEHSQQKSELDLYTITDVECIYYPLYENKYSLSVRYVPCWLISGTCEYLFGNRSKEVDVRSLYNIEDGTQYVER